ncbi:MAG: peptidylprolyl isomerase [Pseudomonadales bacterium]|nr:peptidylprolyl isomerase [Pseudomonadales bacterium]
MTIYRNLVLILTLVLASMNSQAALVLIDRIAVVVDQDVIMQSEIDERIRAIKAQFAAQPNTRVPPDDVLQNQVVERLIIESLQLQMADRAGIRISDAELNEALASIAAQNNMSLDQFRIALANDGMSWAAMREQVRREFAISRVQQGVMRRRIQVSEQEVKNFLASDLGESLTADQYRLGHILLALPDNPGAEDIKRVRSRAETIHQQLLDGEDFASLAIEYSSDQNALSGGDMGWRKPGQLPSIFSDLVEDMEVDDIRGPIKSGRGFHLIKLVEKRGATTEGQIAQTRVRHVLVQPNEIRSDREAEDLAKTLREEVINGREFEEVAKLYSDDPGSALSGGDLGWTRQGVFVPEFEQMMKDSDLGEISEVFKSSHGYHFLEVTGRRVEDFSERFKMGQAENYLRNQKFDEELDSWLREIRDEAFVEIKI